MYGFATLAVLQMVMLTTHGKEYPEAYNQAEKGGKPLLVLVGTNESPDYQLMKQRTVPELSRSESLEKIVFAEVDSDADPALTRQLLRDNSLPQLVLYTPVGNLWRRTHLAGARSQSEILAFLERETARGGGVAEAARKARTTTFSSHSNAMNTYSFGGS